MRAGAKDISAMPLAQGTPSTFTRLRRFAAPLLLVGLVLAAWQIGLFEKLSLSSVIMHRQELAAAVEGNFFLALLAYAAIYCGLVALSFPGASLLSVAAGFFFGGFAAGAVTVFAATGGAVLLFLVARSSFGDYLARSAGRFIRAMAEGFNRDAFFYLLALRLTPLFPFWVINIVPALLNMRLAPYALATFLGIIPGTFAYTYVGSGLDSVIAAQETAHPGCAASGTCEIDVSALVTPQLAVALVALAVISILPLVVRRLRAGGGKGPAAS